MSETTVFQNNDATKTQAPKPVSPAPTVPTQTPKAASYREYTRSGPPMFFGANVLTLIKAAIFGLILLIILFLALRFVPSFLTKTQEKVTLAYWGLWEDNRTIQSVINEFQKENPNIEIAYTKFEIKQYRERLLARSESGKGPDVFRFHNTWLPQLSSLLLPLPTDTISKVAFQNDYYPVVQQDLVKNGAIYGIPLEIDTLALFANTDLFRAFGANIPTTWNDFDAVARSLTVKDGDGNIKTSGAAMGTFDNVTHAPDIISMLFAQNGADMRYLTNTMQSASDTLDFYTSFGKGEGKVWDETLDPSVVAFAKGNVAMYFGYSWDIFTIKALNPKLSFTVSPVPYLPQSNKTIASYWVEGVSTASKHQKEALQFLKFLAKKETAQKLFTEQSKTREFGEPYARVDLADTLKDNQLLYPFVAQGESAVSTFFAGDTYDNGLNSQMNGYLGNAVRSVLGNTSSTTAVEVLSQGVDQVLGQFEREK